MPLIKKPTRPDAPTVETIDRQTLAQAIVRISVGVRSLTASGLNRKAIVVLLSASTHVSQSNIKAVLDGLNSLSKDYCA